ncbi:MAG: DUF3616 domain-containing protein [Verrucomicrobiales bacterium]|nr:DUF3616 domain-containing protein [Verrucomicrobiales bacterium]
MSRIGRGWLNVWSLAALGLMGFSMGTPIRAAHGVIECHGLANASAAVRIGTDRVLVGSDENNALLLYSASAGGAPIKVFETTRWLGLRRGEGEVDFEGAARIGDVLYWIGSHARNKNGRFRPERHRLLALRISHEDGDVELSPVGSAVTALLESMFAAPTLATFPLREASGIAPELSGGLNIEGLSAGPGGVLWIGFRSPVPGGRALLAQLRNPAEFILGRPAEWGTAELLDLGGKGVRDLVWTGQEYFVLGGNAGDGGRTRLYRWAGTGAQPAAVKVPGLKDLNAEGVVAFGTPQAPRILVLSDDGSRKVNDAPDTTKRTFRMMWVDPVPDASPEEPGSASSPR